jgi:hypothetical protein
MNISGIIIIACMAVPVLYDCLAAIFGWTLITTTTRMWDQVSGGLFLWCVLLGFIAIWVHLKFGVGVGY